MREDIVDLVRRLAAIPGIEDLALTTNGVLLERMAVGLKEAGLQAGEHQSGCGGRAVLSRDDRLRSAAAGHRRYAQGHGGGPDSREDQLRGDEGRESLAGPGAGGDERCDLPVSVRFIEYCPTTQIHRAGEPFRAQSRGPRA